MFAANGFRTLAAIVMAVTAVNNALGGSLTSAVTGGAVAVVCALLAISCTIQARGPRADLDVRYIHDRTTGTAKDVA